MAVELSLELAQVIEREVPNLRKLTDEIAAIPRGPGKWSPKEELGHLVDSAANNHMRFVRCALEPEFRGHGYAQEAWVQLHGYQRMPWSTIVDFWFQYNSLLAVLVENIPDDRLERLCFIGEHPAVTLKFLIEDYIVHMRYHIDLLLRRDVVTVYPQK